MKKDFTLLLVGHGSRGATGNQEPHAFAAAWRRQHPEWCVDLCFIEHAEVLLDEGLSRAAKKSACVMVLPLILNAASHVKMDLPVALENARQRHPDVEFMLLPHLGMGLDMQAVLQRQLDQQMKGLSMPDPKTTGVILLGRGSSDAGANGELARMARWLFEDNEYELLDLAFTGVTWPRLETVVQRQVRLGMMQIIILPVYLFDGVLIERIQEQLIRLRLQYPQQAIVLGERFGFDEGIFRLLDQRVAHSLKNADREGTLLACDGCKYRRQAGDVHGHDHRHAATACAPVPGDHTYPHPHPLHEHD